MFFQAGEGRPQGRRAQGGSRRAEAFPPDQVRAGASTINFLSNEVLYSAFAFILPRS
jgi:hypothetical protein